MHHLRTKVGSSVAVAGVLTAALIASAAPASASGSGSTTVTFAVSSGGLAISVPSSVNLGSSNPGGLINAALGSVKVTDQRANLVSTWTASVSSSDFTTGTSTAAETIPSTDLSYFTGAATTTGVSVTLGGLSLGAANKLPLPATAAPALNVAALTAGVGNNTATWNPTLLVAVPDAAVAGTYTGTVTHSVA